MDGLDRMKVRAGWDGYDIHDKRIISGKYKSFKALDIHYS